MWLNNSQIWFLFSWIFLKILFLIKGFLLFQLFKDTLIQFLFLEFRNLVIGFQNLESFMCLSGKKNNELFFFCIIINKKSCNGLTYEFVATEKCIFSFFLV